MKKVIFLYLLIISGVNAQEMNSLFDLSIRPGIGFSKLITKNDRLDPYIPTNSGLGLNLFFSALVEYNVNSRIKLSSGFGFKLKQLNTTITGIITGETIRNNWNPIEISETYTNNYLTIPIIFHYRLIDYINIGIGVSYDYLLTSSIKKVITNNTDPEIEKIGNKFEPGKYTIILFYKYSINNYFSLLPTVMISSDKTTSEIKSNSTGPSLGASIEFEIKI